MKKLFVLAVAALMVVAFTVPAVAGVKMGGRLAFDTYYHTQDEVFRGRTAANLVPTSWSQLKMEVVSSTNMHLKANTDDNKFGLYLEFAMGANALNTVLNRTAGAAGAPAPSVDSMYVRFSYGWWEFSPGCKLVIGQDTTGTAPLNPLCMIGTGAGQFQVVGIGFGNMYTGRVYQVRGEFTMGDLGVFKVALVDPHSSSLGQGQDGGLVGRGAGVSTPVGNEETVMPRFDISADLKLGAFTLYPGIVYCKQTYDDMVAAGAPTTADDEVEVWLYTLGTTFNIGPLRVRAEGCIGQNWGNANMLTDGTYIGYGPGGAGTAGTVGSIDTAARIDPQGKVSDTDCWAYWVDLGYKFGANTLHLILGQQSVENEMGYTVAGANIADLENTRTQISVNCWIPVSKHMIIIPEVDFYDYGDFEEQNLPDVDMGKARIYGINWLIMF
jgi:hypothetical protein